MERFELLKQLNHCHGPSGDEGDIGEAIKKLAEPYADDIKIDVMGNLIVHKKGSGPRVLLAAHMDSIGFIVTHFEKEGFLRVGKLGGIDPKEIIFTPVRFKNGVKGVVVNDESVEIGKLKIGDLLIDIGAESDEEAKKMVQLGDTAVFDQSARFLGDSKVVSPYIDNRISCVILLEALAQIQQPENDMYFLFSTQEEVGLRGAKVATYGIDPDYGIAVDVTIADDAVGCKHSSTTHLGKGAGIKLMDSAIICSPILVAQLEAIAKENNIQTQREIMGQGSTDAGVMHTTRMGVISGGISVPCRYIHTPVETADLRDIDACVQLIVAVAKTKLNEV